MSNIHNPNGQAIMVGGMPHGIVAGFNSGHAASMQGIYGSPTPAPTPQTDRPFKCDQCPQSFNRNHDLKRHKRIHLAVKPFPCGHCDKSFSRKDALKVRTLLRRFGCEIVTNYLYSAMFWSRDVVRLLLKLLKLQSKKQQTDHHPQTELLRMETTSNP
jgi:Zinc finger, C2H2 type